MSTKWEMLDRKSGLPSRNHINRRRRSKDLYWYDRGIIQETICEPQEIHQQPSLLQWNRAVEIHMGFKEKETGLYHQLVHFEALRPPVQLVEIHVISALRRNCQFWNQTAHDFWINIPNCFRNAATVLSLARETLNARAIEMSRQTSVRCMAFANNKKEQLSRQSPEDRFIAWNTV